MSPVASTAVMSGSVQVRLITFNIRLTVTQHYPEEQPWHVRCPKLCAQLRFITLGHTSPFLCLQEVTYPQLLDIQNSLGPGWSHIGRGRDDGKTAGEFSPIFFRSDHWECTRQATFWLSKTPEVISKSWDATLMRIVTMGAFRHRKTGATTIIMSTHLDHSGALAREESARLLLNLAKRWADESTGPERPPLFLGGDFNSTPISKPYQVITSPHSGMKDISELVPDEWRYGNPEITYTSFGQESPLRIDYLFVLEPSGLNFLTFGVLQNRFDDMLYLSDHRPVVADVEIPAPLTDDMKL